MPGNIILPQWGMGMNEGEVVRWLKSVGDPVVKGEPLVEIESTKVSAEVEATADGTLGRIVVDEGKTVPVGTVLGLLLMAGETDRDLPAVEMPRKRASTSPRRSASARRSSGKIVVTPRARRLARELNVELDTIDAGTGPSGRITEDDVRAAAEASTSTVADGMKPSRTIPLTGIRGTIAKRMSESASAALVTLNTTGDVTEALAMRRQLTREWRRSRVRPQYQDLAIAATVRALKDNPLANAHITDDEVQVFETINLGFALAVADGLLVPVVRDAGSKSPLELALTVRELARKSKSNELTVAELSGSTFSLTNLSSYDVESFTPLINPPEVGILGVGRVVEQPAVMKSGEIEVRSIGYFSLTFDHRAWDGAPAAEFLQAVVKNLADPGWMAGG
jgi:pyruvate dehydrogenase E2 component (dihydrolipoamide acetyltransferase)